MPLLFIAPLAVLVILALEGRARAARSLVLRAPAAAEIRCASIVARSLTLESGAEALVARVSSARLGEPSCTQHRQHPIVVKGHLNHRALSSNLITTCQ